MSKKQLQVPGTERPTVKEIDDAAEAYVEQRDKRMKLSEKEKAAKDALIGAMKKHALTIYRDDSHSPPLVVYLTTGEDKVKVEAADELADDEDSAADAA